MAVTPQPPGLTTNYDPNQVGASTAAAAGTVGAPTTQSSAAASLYGIPETLQNANVIFDYGLVVKKPGGPHVGVRAAEPVPLLTAVANFWTLPTGQTMAHLQRQLVAAGYLTDADVHYGQRDSATFAAYRSMLVDVTAAQNGGQHLTPDQYLAKLTASAPAGDQPGGAKISNLGETTARGSLESALTQEAGRSIASSGEVSDFQSADNAAFRAAQQPGAASYDTSVAAEEYVRSKMGAEVGSTSALHYYDLIMSKLGLA